MLLGLLRFGNGVLGILDINWLSPTKLRELTVIGEKGMYRVDYLTQNLYFYEKVYHPADDRSDQSIYLKGGREGNVIKYALQRREPLEVELESFAMAVYEGHKPLVDGLEGLQALRIAELLLKSGHSHTIISGSILEAELNRTETNDEAMSG
jgi:predicted dehydrogenase